jgi:hypothetical protein
MVWEFQNSLDCFHLMILAWLRLIGGIGDVAGFDADHFRPFCVVEVRKRFCVLNQRIPEILLRFRRPMTPCE